MSIAGSGFERMLSLNKRGGAASLKGKANPPVLAPNGTLSVEDGSEF